jgi:hypothetical protein
MARCPTCDYPLPESRERLGARCPNCRASLYEPAGNAARKVREGEAACAVHPTNESVGTCARCGNYLCEVCRSRWRDQILCAACVARYLEAREAGSEQTRASLRRALLALGLGIGAWALCLLGFLLASLVATAAGGAGAVIVAGLLAIIVFLAASVLALFGVGQAAAVLRLREGHLILATIGLILSGLYVGLLVGFFALNLWQT